MQFDRLKRREFITLLGGESLAWPLAAPAQQPTMTVIGFLHSASPEPNADRVRAFRQALKDTGYVEGENVAILYRWAEGRYDRLPELAAELVRRQVAVIAASDTGSATAAKAATTTIPIVFGVGEDPVRLGLVASLSRPGGNATGVNFFVTELGSKQLGLLHELIPAAARVGLLVNPNYPTMKRTMRDVTVTASAIGLQVDVFQASDSREIESVFGTLVRNRADALLVGPDAWEPGFSAGIRFSTQAIKTGKCAKRNWQTVRQCAPQKSRAAKVR
jgi:putative tryptophan/tyrosine transport system substrate-binding protein